METAGGHWMSDQLRKIRRVSAHQEGGKAVPPGRRPGDLALAVEAAADPHADLANDNWRRPPTETIMRRATPRSRPRKEP